MNLQRVFLWIAFASNLGNPKLTTIACLEAHGLQARLQLRENVLIS